MISRSFLVLAPLALGLVACGVGSEADSDVAQRPAPTLAAGELPRLGGWITLRGGIAAVTSGTLFLTVSASGTKSSPSVPLLRRAYEVLDPGFTSRAGSRSLRFQIDARDALSNLPSKDAIPRTSAFELELCFDPDGLVATEDPGVQRVRTHVATGRDDIVIELVTPISAATAATGSVDEKDR